MNEQESKGRNIPFIIFSVLFSILTVSLIIAFIFSFGSGNYYISGVPYVGAVSSIYNAFILAVLWSLITVMFIKGEQIAWYLATGYFIFLPLFAIAQCCYQVISQGLTSSLSFGDATSLFLNVFASTGIIGLLFLCALIVGALFLKKIHEKFGLDFDGFFAKLFMIEVIYILLLWGLPQLFTLFGSSALR